MREYYWMQVWEKQGSSYLTFNNDDGSSMGRTAENDHISAGLYEQLKNEKSVEFIFGDPVKSMKRVDGIMEVELESGKVLESRLVVGSDGNNSAVKRVMGIPTFGWSHHQRAIVRGFFEF
jgi:2-polyprenyl-6-methoxyphenol hydroxylase-like FAD-dependent oxidoreductase